MEDLKKRVFLISGSDFFQRRQVIENIKAKIFSGKPYSLNTFNIYSNDVDIVELQEKIFTFSFDKEKLIIFKDAYNLPKEVKNFLFSNIEKITSANYLILEIDKDFYQLQREKAIAGDKFFNLVFKQGYVHRISSYSEKISLDDFRMSLQKNDFSTALYILEKLFEGKSKEREIGPLILGMLTARYSYSKNFSVKKRNFRYLLETDRILKETDLDVRLAIEMLLVRLWFECRV